MNRTERLRSHMPHGERRSSPGVSRGSTLVAALSLTLAAAPLAASAARADTAEGGVPGAWLMEYSGARTLGLGGAFVATADDAMGVLWNPAGLQRMDQNELMFENVQLFDQTSTNSLSFAVPGSRLPSFGLTAVALRSGEFQRTNELNDDLGSFKESETAYLFTMSKNVGQKLSLGTNLKLVQQSVEDFSAGGFGFDVGGIYEVVPSLRVGVSALNISGPSIKLRDTAEDFPMQIRGGASMDVLGGRGLVAVEADHIGDLAMKFHGGLEYWIQSGIALRVGFDQDRASGGFSYRFAPAYRLDYGVADHPLGLTHRVGLTYRFGGFFASSRAEPEVFSPTGEHATTKISLNARTKASADTWSLELVGKTNTIVRSFSGPGLPPPHIQWDGKDETGLPVADGVYTYHLVVKDKEGRVLMGPTRKVEIATGGPQGDVPVTTTESPEQQGPAPQPPAPQPPVPSTPPDKP